MNNSNKPAHSLPFALPKPAIYLILLLAGGAQTLTLAPFEYWILGPLSIALILYTTGFLNPACHSEDKSDAILAFKFGWVFGLGLFGSGASWVYVSINTYGHAPPVLASSLTIVFVAGLALFTAFNFWLYQKLKSTNIYLNALSFTTVWIIGDGIRTVFLTGFPWLFLGYAHLETPLSGWIPTIGLYGVTGIVVLSGALLAALILKSIKFKNHSITEENNSLSTQVSDSQASNNQASDNKTALKAGIATIMILPWIIGPVLNQIDWSKPILDKTDKPVTHTVALLQTNIPQEDKWKTSQRGKTLNLLRSMSSAQWDKDLIVWPETAVPQLYDLARHYISRMSKQAKETDTTIISGIPYRHINKEDNRQTLHNSIMSIGDGNGIYHKQKLVPFGEYVPLQEVLRGLIQFFDLPMSDFRTGPSEQDNLKVGEFITSPFICYEVVYPDFVASRAVDADYLLTISNDSWFGSSIGPIQHLEMAQYRAAENARYMVRGTNNGISAIIDHKGRVTARTEQFVRTTLESSVELRSGRTLFSYTGSTPLFLICAAFILYRYFKRRQGVKSTKN